jgi:drug/metabolite transporter (DMT)-like permease
MWLVFALTSPLCWAVVHVLDAHCVERVFDRPWMGVITSALASVVAFLLIPFVAPFVPWQVPSWEIALLALLAGGLIQFSQGFYFQALAYSEAGIVAAYWNMIPTFLPVASFAILGSVLAQWHYVGIGLLVVASVAFCLLDSNFEARWRSLFLMVIASCLQVAALLIEKHVFEHSPFFVGFLIITAGIVLSGSLPLVLPSVRTAFKNNMATLRPAFAMIVAIEVINLAALFLSQRAISLGVPSLVAAVESTIPAYTFLFSFVFVLITKRFGDPKALRRLPAKFLLGAVMAIGVWLLS